MHKIEAKTTRATLRVGLKMELETSMHRLQWVSVLAALALLSWALPGHQRTDEASGGRMRLRHVQRIWEAAPHNAFTDLIRHGNRWYCVCREGKDHISFDGKLRLLVSKDGRRWKSAAALVLPGADLRDGKLSLTPEGTLMLTAGARFGNETPKLQSLVWFSRDGRQWRGPIRVADPDYWLWRVTWHHGTCYGIGYACGTRHNIRLYTSTDGHHFATLVPTLYDLDYANESSIVFLEGDTAVCLLRRDPEQGLLGLSAPPYTAWRWLPLGVRIGGPHLLRLPDGRLLAAVRLYEDGQRTSLCWVDHRRGTLTEALALPSGGDTGYAGLVWQGNTLWISYYSSHEEKTAVYLARVEVPLMKG